MASERQIEAAAKAIYANAKNTDARAIARIALAAAEQAEPASVASTGAVKVKPLEWEETHTRRSEEDPTTEWNGGFEADSALGYYEISMGFGSDAYYWVVTNPFGDVVGSTFEDPSYAKAAAQADYEHRIRSALENGWVMVPREPTRALTQAWQVAEDDSWALQPDEDDPHVHGAAGYRAMLAALEQAEPAAEAVPEQRPASHPAITHCDNCGCDWLDNGLNPVGCPYCKKPEPIATSGRNP